MINYIHHQQGHTVLMGFGDYLIAGEGRVAACGHEYLYVIADAPVGSVCVGAGCLRFIHVRGRVISWHARLDTSGFPVSEIETVTRADEMDAVKARLREIYPSLQVCF